MRTFPYFAVFLALASSVKLFHYSLEQDRIDLLRNEALLGNISSVRELATSDFFLWPQERCAWSWLLAQHDTGRSMRIEDVHYCTLVFKPEGYAAAKAYADNLSQKVTLY